jgi:putative endonuclease
VSAEWFVYLLALGDGTLYCGIAKDVEARLALHRAGRGARYVRGRGEPSLVLQAGPYAHGTALRLERAVKRTPRARKSARLAAGPREELTLHDG